MVVFFIASAVIFITKTVLTVVTMAASHGAVKSSVTLTTVSVILRGTFIHMLLETCVPIHLSNVSSYEHIAFYVILTIILTTVFTPGANHALNVGSKLGAGTAVVVSRLIRIVVVSVMC